MRLYYLFFIILFFSCGRSTKNDVREVNWQEVFSGDSGTLDTGESKALLVAMDHALITDTSVFSKAVLFSKYYYDKDKGLYLGYMDGFIDDNFLLYEVSLKKGKIKNSRSLMYGHDNYNCCSGAHNEFRKHGRYYSFKTCGTGSAYCASDLYFFKEIQPKENMTPLVVSMDSRDFGIYLLSSDMTERGDTLIIKYLLQTSEDYTEPYDSTKYTVRFLWKDNQMQVLDTLNN